jgi:hypothetical protein
MSLYWLIRKKYDCADELLTMAEPTLDIDLSVVISRPPAFVENEDDGVRVKTSLPGVVDKRKYSEFPRFRRVERNARSNPFA